MSFQFWRTFTLGSLEAGPQSKLLTEGTVPKPCFREFFVAAIISISSGLVFRYYVHVGMLAPTRTATVNDVRILSVFYRYLFITHSCGNVVTECLAAG